MNMKFNAMTEQDVVQLIEYLKSQMDNMPSIILLNGEVGTGKTTFTRHFIETTKTKLAFSSPTYNIVSIYDDISPVIHHFDLYRISVDDYEWIYETMDSEDKILIFEWADLHAELFEDVEWLQIQFVYEKTNTRTLILDASNEKYLNKLGDFKRC